MAGERGYTIVDGRLFVCTCVSNLSIGVCARYRLWQPGQAGVE